MFWKLYCLYEIGIDVWLLIKYIFCNFIYINCFDENSFIIEDKFDVEFFLEVDFKCDMSYLSIYDFYMIEKVLE